MRTTTACTLALTLLSSACDEGVGKGNPDGGGPVGEGVPITFDVPASGRAFLRLATPEVVTVPDDGASSTGWDLAFSGYDVFTNSGLSGPGDGGSFPLDPADYDSGTDPGVPFMIEDAAGGAFGDWYAYNPQEHVIYSRFHVYGVESAGRYWKVQLYTFYGDVQGAPVSGIYSFQHAEVTAAGPGPTTQRTAVDATAGGSAAPETEPSACLDLAADELRMLTPSEAAARTDWHLCFRRAMVTVNGELGGPGAVRAADLDGAKTRSETLEQVMARTQATEAARFDAIGHAELTDPALVYRGDRIVSGFSDRWATLGASPAPADIAWLLQEADGVTRHIAKLDRFEGATADTPGRVTMLLKNLK